MAAYYLKLMSVVCLSVVLLQVEGRRERVRLSDINVLTLHHGQFTEASRTHRVPQLKCVGGTAGCSAFVPKVVQCYNRGSDGSSIQWECKTDMDNAYRFGEISVGCEGYDDPEDKYVLKGSCGLEYELDFTKEGYEKQSKNRYGGSTGQHQYYGSSHNENKISWGSSIVYIVILIVIVVVVYRMYFADNNANATVPPQPDIQPPSYSSLYNNPSVASPPPPGFRSEFMPRNRGAESNLPPYNPDHTAGYGSAGYTGGGASYRPKPNNAGGSNDGPGFWSGAAAGGVLGYLFGSSRNQQPTTGGTWGSGRSWGSSSGGWGSSSSRGGGSSWGSGSSASSGSTGTRTASGFGGTRNR